MSLYGLTDCVPEFYIVSVINSSFISHYVDDFVNNTQTFQINDARQLPIIVPSVEQANYIKERIYKLIKCKKSVASEHTTDLCRDLIATIEMELSSYVESIYSV